MAFKKWNGIILAAVLFVLAASEGAWAATYVVGDGLGWTVPPSPTAYSNWASQHTFLVGDVLVFNFTAGFHDVARVTSAAYGACSSNSPIALATLGPASFTLNSTGPDYYICTFGQHCSIGQRLMVTVTSSSSSSPPATSPMPVPTPPSMASPPAGSTTTPPSMASPPAGSTTPSPAGSTTPSPAGSTTPSPAGSTAPPPAGAATPTPSVMPLPTPSMSPSSSSPMGSPGSAPSLAPSGSGMAPGPSSGGALSPGGGAGGAGVGDGAPGPGPSSGSTDEGTPGSFATKTPVFTPLAVIALLAVGLVM